MKLKLLGFMIFIYYTVKTLDLITILSLFLYFITVFIIFPLIYYINKSFSKIELTKSYFKYETTTLTPTIRKRGFYKTLLRSSQFVKESSSEFNMEKYTLTPYPSKRVEEMIDGVINEIINYYILPYAEMNNWKFKRTEEFLRQFLKGLFSDVIHRMSVIEWEEFLCITGLEHVQGHIQFLKSRNYQTIDNDYFMGQNTENLFIEAVANRLLRCLLDKKYLQCDFVYQFCVAVLAHQVIKKTVEYFSDPATLNIWIAGVLIDRKAQKWTRSSGKSNSGGGLMGNSAAQFQYDMSYEEFYKLIKSLNEPEELRKIRSKLSKEIKMVDLLKSAMDTDVKSHKTHGFSEVTTPQGPLLTGSSSGPLSSSLIGGKDPTSLLASLGGSGGPMSPHHLKTYRNQLKILKNTVEVRLHETLPIVSQVPLRKRRSSKLKQDPNAGNNGSSHTGSSTNTGTGKQTLSKKIIQKINFRSGGGGGGSGNSGKKNSYDSVISSSSTSVGPVTTGNLSSAAERWKALKECVPYDKMMETEEGRRLFKEYLNKTPHSRAVELVELLTSFQEQKNERYVIAQNIMKRYINCTPVAFEFDKSISKEMAEFLRGNGGDDIFFRAKNLVNKELKRQYYPYFMLSPYYVRLVRHLTKELEHDLNDQEAGVNSEEASAVDETSYHNDDTDDSDVDLDDVDDDDEDGGLGRVYDEMVAQDTCSTASMGLSVPEDAVSKDSVALTDDGDVENTFPTLTKTQETITEGGDDSEEVTSRNNKRKPLYDFRASLVKETAELEVEELDAEDEDDEEEDGFLKPRIVVDQKMGESDSTQLPSLGTPPLSHEPGRKSSSRKKRRWLGIPGLSGLVSGVTTGSSSSTASQQQTVLGEFDEMDLLESRLEKICRRIEEKEKARVALLEVMSKMPLNKAEKIKMSGETRLVEEDLHQLRERKNQCLFHLRRLERWRAGSGKWRARVYEVVLPEPKRGASVDLGHLLSQNKQDTAPGSGYGTGPGQNASPGEDEDNTRQVIIVMILGLSSTSPSQVKREPVDSSTSETTKGAATSSNLCLDESSSMDDWGWIVKRNLKEFQGLRKELSQVCPALEKVSMPKVPQRLFIRRKYTENDLGHIKSSLDNFLKIVMSEPRLRQGEQGRSLMQFFCFSTDEEEAYLQAGSGMGLCTSEILAASSATTIGTNLPGYNFISGSGIGLGSSLGVPGYNMSSGLLAGVSATNTTSSSIFSKQTILGAAAKLPGKLVQKLVLQQQSQATPSSYRCSASTVNLEDSNQNNTTSTSTHTPSKGKIKVNTPNLSSSYSTAGLLLRNKRLRRRSSTASVVTQQTSGNTNTTVTNPTNNSGTGSSNNSTLSNNNLNSQQQQLKQMQKNIVAKDVSMATFELLEELIQLRKSMTLTRRSLISLVQSVFGKNLSSLLTDRVAELQTEHTIFNTLQKYRDSFHTNTTNHNESLNSNTWLTSMESESSNNGHTHTRVDSLGNMHDNLINNQSNTNTANNAGSKPSESVTTNNASLFLNYPMILSPDEAAKRLVWDGVPESWRALLGTVNLADIVGFVFEAIQSMPANKALLYRVLQSLVDELLIEDDDY